MTAWCVNVDCVRVGDMMSCVDPIVCENGLVSSHALSWELGVSIGSLHTYNGCSQVSQV